VQSATARHLRQIKWREPEPSWKTLFGQRLRCPVPRFFHPSATLSSAG
jgi:hypothetical protein